MLAGLANLVYPFSVAVSSRGLICIVRRDLSCATLETRSTPLFSPELKAKTLHIVHKDMLSGRSKLEARRG